MFLLSESGIFVGCIGVGAGFCLSRDFGGDELIKSQAIYGGASTPSIGLFLGFYGQDWYLSMDLMGLVRVYNGILEYRCEISLCTARVWSFRGNGDGI